MDVALIFGYWIGPNQQIVKLSDNSNECVTVAWGTLFVLWVIANDVIITPYCLLVFVLPLRKIMKVEKQQSRLRMEMYQSNSNNSQVNCDLSADVDSDEEKKNRPKLTLTSSTSTSKYIPKKNEFAVSNLVRKVIICNTIAMAQILVQCGLASNGWTGDISGNVLIFNISCITSIYVLRCYVQILNVYVWSTDYLFQCCFQYVLFVFSFRIII